MAPQDLSLSQEVPRALWILLCQVVLQYPEVPKGPLVVLQCLVVPKDL